MRAFSVLVLLLSACRPTWGHYLVPVGADGVVPEGAGGACEVRGAPGVLTLTEREFHVDAPGSVRLRCAKADVELDAAPLDALHITGPTRITFRAFPYGAVEAEAFAGGGQPFDLGVLRQGTFAWTTTGPLSVQQPSCGHMMPLCVGLVGNGKLQKLDAKEPGAGSVQLVLLGKTATLAITVDPAK